MYSTKRKNKYIMRYETIKDDNTLRLSHKKIIIIIKV